MLIGGNVRLRLGIDVACKAVHQATCADETGKIVFSGRRFRTTESDLQALWASLPAGAEEVLVVMEPTRNAWVVLAAWLRARGALVVLVPPEQSADLRDYYSKHAKNDRLDSKMLARLPLLHPDGLRPGEEPGPYDALRRAVRRRSKLVKQRTAVFARIDALLELLGPHWEEALDSDDGYGKAALAVLAGGGADPGRLKRLGLGRLTTLLIKTSQGRWRQDKAEQVLAAAQATLTLWPAGGLDFAELAADVAGEARLASYLSEQIEALQQRIDRLYAIADPKGIVVSGPGLGPILAAGILGRLGDPSRFDSLRGVRAFTGLVPGLNQSGTSERHGPPTKAGDPGLRDALFNAADKARKVDPTIAARYHDLVVSKGKHHNSALCTIAATLATRIAGCWRNGNRYQLRDTDGREITPAEGRQICATRYAVTDADRAKVRSLRAAQRLKQRQHQPQQGTGRCVQKPHRASPSRPPSVNATRHAPA
jgi:transposase